MIRGNGTAVLFSTSVRHGAEQLPYRVFSRITAAWLRRHDRITRYAVYRWVRNSTADARSIATLVNRAVIGKKRPVAQFVGAYM